MNFTDDNPEILLDVRPIRGRAGPVAISNHSQYGFNIRHFYRDWQTGEWKATQKGISIMPADVPIFLTHLADFINENDVLNGRKVIIAFEGGDKGA